MLLRLEGVGRTLVTRTLFRDVDLTLNPGDRLGLVGPNGAGKTTLLRIAAGADTPDSGRVLVPRHVHRGFLRQEIDPAKAATVRAEAASALAHLDEVEAEIRALEVAIEELGRAGRDVPDDLAERWDAAQAAFAFGGGFERAARVERVLAGLGFSADALDRPLSAFSGGWLMRVELAKLLLSAPDVLLLDEPTNHLDLPSIEWFEGTLAEFRGAAIIVSHDRAFLRRHANRIAELEGGRVTVYAGAYDRFLEQRALAREQLEAALRNQDRKRAETERFIERFRYKASKARQVQSRVKALAKLERVELPDEPRKAMRLRLPEAPRAGRVVLRLTDIHKRYGETVVYEGVDFELGRGDRVALVGPNGAGKSTLLRIAAGALEPDAGERALGHNVRAAFYAQHQLEVLDPQRTVLEELASDARVGEVGRLRDHLGAFLFSGDDVEKRVAVLSGGEKARLALAKLLLRPVNLLVLDEPTNHLDVRACEVLEQALRSFAGTLLFISHDRDFIDALATKVLEVRDGSLSEHAGNYSAFRTPSAAAAPAPSKRDRMRAREEAREVDRELVRRRRRVDSLEEQIGEHEAQLTALEERLADPDVWRDGDAVRELEVERSRVRDALDGIEAEWEQLATRLEDTV